MASWPWLRLLALAALAACCARTAAASQYDPHLPEAAQRSWFEGWYLRLVPDVAANGAAAPASLALIIGAIPHAPATWNSTMVTLLVQNASLADPAPAVYTRANMQLDIAAAGGAAVSSDPSFSGQPNFTIAAADGSLLLEMGGGRCQLHAWFEGAYLHAECTGPPLLPWDASGYGPEGCVATWPTFITGLHWFVHSLATPMHFTLIQGSQPPVPGVAMAHMEKNWGHTFPSGWYWAQGLNMSSSNSSNSSSTNVAGIDGGSASSGTQPQAAFVLAGGRLPSPLVPEEWMPDLWLLGVRTGNHSWDFHPYDSIFIAQAQPCKATLLITATQPLARRAVEVRIEARRNSFSSLQCPTRQGFTAFSDESFTAYATVRLFEYRVSYHERGWVQKRLLEAFEFEGAALEMGGEYRCQEPAEPTEPAEAATKGKAGGEGSGGEEARSRGTHRGTAGRSLQLRQQHAGREGYV